MSTKKTTVKTAIENKEVQQTVSSAVNPPADVYGKDMLLEVNKRSKAIKAELKKVESSFSRIAFNLHWIYENEGFKPLGYKNVYDFACIEFGISRGTCNNFINVVERFAKRTDGQIIEEIDDIYKDFKSSQLILMLELTDETIKNSLNPKMSVREMKKAVKDLSSDSSAENEAENEKADTSDSGNEPLDVDAKEVNRQVLITLGSMEEYNSQEDKIYDMICRALKDPKHRLEIAYTWE